MNTLMQICDSVLHYLGLCHIEMHYFNMSLIYIGHALFYFFAKYGVFRYIYRYDDSKRYASIKVLIAMNIVSFITWIVAEVSHDYEHLKVATIFSIAYISKFTFHILSFINLKMYGKPKEFCQEVTNSLKKQKLKKIFFKKLASVNDEERIVLNKEFYYIVKEKKFYRNIVTNVPNQTSRFIDIMIFIIVFFIALSLIIPAIGELNAFLNNSYILAIFAFIFVYVLGPVYPNLYGSFLVIKNEHIDMGDFIFIKEKGIKGRLIEVKSSWVKLKDHTTGTILTIPSKYFSENIVENLSKLQSSYGIKHVLEYVLSYKSYKDDCGENIRRVFKAILDDLEKDMKSVFKGDMHCIWIIPDNDGVKVTIWYFVTDIEREERIKLDVEDYILRVCTKNDLDLTTPDLIEVI